MYWNRTVEKYGYTVELLFTDLDEPSALSLETDLIRNFKIYGAILCNLTEGGEGTSGYRMSEESKKKMSDAKKGRETTDAHRGNLSRALKGIPKSPETVEKIRKSLTGKKQDQAQKDKRAATLREVSPHHDPNIYLFFNSEDVYVGTRKEFSLYAGLKLKQLRPLFQTKKNKTMHKWSVLDNQLLIYLKGI